MSLIRRHHISAFFMCTLPCNAMMTTRESGMAAVWIYFLLLIVLFFFLCVGWTFMDICRCTSFLLWIWARTYTDWGLGTRNRSTKGMSHFIYGRHMQQMKFLVYKQTRKRRIFSARKSADFGQFSISKNNRDSLGSYYFIHPTWFVINDHLILIQRRVVVNSFWWTIFCKNM